MLNEECHCGLCFDCLATKPCLDRIAWYGWSGPCRDALEPALDRAGMGVEG